MRKLGAIACAIAVTVAAAMAVARAQQFPDRPIKVVVAYPPGGVGDTVTRVATQGLGPVLGQSVIVENIAGAGGRVGTRFVARAAPDGYTLAAGGTNDNAVTPALYGKLDYDPVKDFAPVVALAIDFERVGGKPGGAGAFHCRTGDLCQGASGQADLRFDHRHCAASFARIPPRPHRHRHAVRAL